jgi:phosphatidylserine decarboxylase
LVLYVPWMATGSEHSDVKRRAGWLPDQDALETWLAGHRQRVEAKGTQVVLHPVIAEFRELLDREPVLRMYVERMIAEVPHTKAYSQRHLESVDQLLRLINEVLTMAPEFGDQAMTLPLNAILDWTMGTTAGFAVYRDVRFNAMLKKVLTVWCEFLSSGDSRYVLNETPSGWKSGAARQAVRIEQYEHDPDDEFWGFASWNDYFTRRFTDGQRPVDSPDDDKVIVSACESTPYAIKSDVQLRDRFWIKSQPYSLADMLAGDESVEEFVGGTVYQAFLSATNYHRWHSPVAGTIVRAFVQEGTYYSEADSEGPNAVESQNSQGYLAHVAARAIILIHADDPVIGLMAFLPVGMNEVSSCLINPNIKAGYHVAKGAEVGYFQFGGSTHCLIFRPGVIADFALQALPQPGDPESPLVRVRSRLATARATKLSDAHPRSPGLSPPGTPCTPPCHGGPTTSSAASTPTWSCCSDALSPRPAGCPSDPSRSPDAAVRPPPRMPPRDECDLKRPFRCLLGSGPRHGRKPQPSDASTRRHPTALQSKPRSTPLAVHGGGEVFPIHGAHWSLLATDLTAWTQLLVSAPEHPARRWERKRKRLRLST